MKLNTGILLAACLALIVVLGSCNTAQTGALPAAKGQPAAELAAPALAAELAQAFPAPLGLMRAVSGPPADPDRLRPGTGYDSLVPRNRYGDGKFTPDWPQPGQFSLEHAAYAGYRFNNMGGYSGTARVYLDWKTPPANAPDVFLGVANFESNRWDWLAPGNDNEANLGDWGPYISTQEQVLLVVCVLGTGTPWLNNIILGDVFFSTLSIQSDLDLDPTQNLAPLTVNWDCSGAVCFGGEITSFDYDWEGDGVWDLMGDTDGISSHLYLQGSYTFTVRAHSTGGVDGIGEKLFVAVNPANLDPTASFTHSAGDGVAPDHLSFDASGSSDPDGEIIRYEWDFNADGVFEVDGGSDPTASHIFGIAGSNQAKLRVTDSDLATDTNFVSIVLNSGWKHKVLDGEVDINARTSMAVLGTGIDARACVAYQQFTTRDLRFARALTEDGSSWTAPVTPAGTATENGYSPSVVRNGSVNAPLIAYGMHVDGTDYLQYVVRGTDSYGGSWHPPVIVSGDNAGADSQLLMVNAIPAIAAVVNDGLSALSEIRYYLALDVEGNAWKSPMIVVADSYPGSVGDVSLAAVSENLFKRPALAFRLDPGSGPARAAYAYANDVDGQDWNAPQLLDVYAGDTALGYFAGAPLLAAGSTAQGGRLYIGRADDDFGAAWSAGLSEVGGGGGGNFALVDGKPACCYFDFEGSDLYFLMASDAEGSSWEEPYKVDAVGDVGRFCSLAAVNGRPMICYFDGDHNDLKLAYFD